MCGNLLNILDEYFVAHMCADGINARISCYEVKYSSLHTLLCDLDAMSKQAGNTGLPTCWEDKLDAYFNDCMMQYILNDDGFSELNECYAKKYIPYEFDYCNHCGIRCYYGTYLQADKQKDGTVLCEHCSEGE